jgi:hypothetical protein
VQLTPRPAGVTVLAVLAILAGIFSVAFGIPLLTIAALASALLLVNGIVDFVLAIGYLGGNGWAWVLGIVFGIINIGGSIIEIALGSSNNIIGIIFSIITIYYLTRAHVKAFFGRDLAMASAKSPTPKGSVMPTSSDSTMFPMGLKCNSCGADLPAGAAFCENCGRIQY